MRITVRALDLVRAARAVVPHYAESRLSAEDMRALLALASLDLQRRPIEAPAILLPAALGPRLLLVRQTRLSHAAERFLVLREIGLLLSRNMGAVSAAEVFALSGIFARQEIAEQGRRWVGRKMLDLKDVGREWYESRLTTLFQDVARVVGSSHRPPGPTADASYAYEVGRIARQSADYARAELWFEAGGNIARDRGDVETAVKCIIGSGNVHKAAGRIEKAKAAYLHACTLARQHELVALSGSAYHELMLIAMLEGDAAEAARCASLASHAYGPHHHRLPVLAQDIAHLWSLQGHAEQAYAVLGSLWPVLSGTDVQLHLLGEMARNAGACGNRDGFESAWREAQDRILRAEADACSPLRSAVAETLLDLAAGARMLGEWERAEWAAVRAMEVAVQRGERLRENLARATLHLVRVRSHATPTPVPDVSVTQLASELVRWLGGVAV